MEYCARLVTPSNHSRVSSRHVYYYIKKKKSLQETIVSNKSDKFILFSNLYYSEAIRDDSVLFQLSIHTAVHVLQFHLAAASQDFSAVCGLLVTFVSDCRYRRYHNCDILCISHYPISATEHGFNRGFSDVKPMVPAVYLIWCFAVPCRSARSLLRFRIPELF